MERRELLGALGGLTIAGMATTAIATEPPDVTDHSHHQHHDEAGNSALAAASADCVTKGNICMAHCLVLLGDGDKGMVQCARSVNQMLAFCSALQKIAAQNSSRTAALAKLTLEVCAECEKECRRHEKKHAECKACADACAECIKQCKAMA
jgi:Cys-rich four helix bundle protein (predicted Tat secretion target)